MAAKKQVEIFTDGACSGNPGPGGYGVILRYKGGQQRAFRRGGADHQQPHGADRRHHRLSALKEPCAVTLYSDSKYIIDAIQKGWAKKWRANGWMRNGQRTPASTPTCGKSCSTCWRNMRSPSSGSRDTRPPGKRTLRQLAVQESLKFKA